MKQQVRLLATSAATLALWSALPAAASTYGQTRYPIVLAHGMTGFDNIGPIDYWYRIPSNLRANGATVYVTQVSAFNSSELRDEQLLEQVEEIVAVSGKPKVNLIGHSHGNHSSRYVAGVRPDLVASVTSVSGPTFGSPVADVVQGVSDLGGPTLTKVVASVVSGLGKLVALLSGNPQLPQDSFAGMQSLTTKGAADFNRRFPGGGGPPRLVHKGPRWPMACATTRGAGLGRSTTCWIRPITRWRCRARPSWASRMTAWSGSAPATWARSSGTTTA